MDSYWDAATRQVFAAFSPRLDPGSSSPALPDPSRSAPRKENNTANCFAIVFPQLQLAHSCISFISPYSASSFFFFFSSAAASRKGDYF